MEEKPKKVWKKPVPLPEKVKTDVLSFSVIVRELLRYIDCISLFSKLAATFQDASIGHFNEGQGLLAHPINVYILHNRKCIKWEWGFDRILLHPPPSSRG